MAVDYVHCTWAVILFLLGLAVGSFLNVVAWRWPAGLSLFRPSSFCPRCGTPLLPRDNIPILGYLLLRGKCRHCAGRIHLRYPAVELITGILYAACGFSLGSQPFPALTSTAVGLVSLAFIAVLILIAILDYDHRIIPDALSIGGLFATLILSPVLPSLHHAETVSAFSRHYPTLAFLLSGHPPWRLAMAAAVVGAASGFIVGLAVRAIGGVFLHRQAVRAGVDGVLGWGDVKLLAFLGAFLGWRSVIPVFAVAAIVGAGFGVLLRRKRDVGVISFGGFLAGAGMGFLFFGEWMAGVWGL